MTTRTTGVIRVAVVDDQPLLVSAFSALVAAQPDMEVVLEAVNGRQAVEGLTARATGPHGGADLVLMDLRMPVLDGVSAIRELRAAPATASLRVLVLTTFDDDDLVLAAPAPTGSSSRTPSRRRCWRRSVSSPAEGPGWIRPSPEPFWRTLMQVPDLVPRRRRPPRRHRSMGLCPLWGRRRVPTRRSPVGRTPYSLWCARG